MNKMLESLNQIGKKTHLWQGSDGCRAVILPYGARILGLYPKDDDENFFWTNPDLCDPDRIKAIFDSGKWQNTGGDRTWLSPELDIFFPDYPDTKRHWEPPQLDASEYFVTGLDHSLKMQKEMRLKFARPKLEVSINLTKEILPADNPLRDEIKFKSITTGTSYAGYTLKCHLHISEENVDSINAGIWNLVQLPHGGEMRIPVYHKTEPLIMFGKIPHGKLISNQNCVHFKVDFPGEHKIAVRAAASTGRTGYIFKTGDTWNLVIRNFFVNLSGRYVDVPVFDPDDTGYAVNAVNVQSALGDFSEMEYHAPAVGKDTGTGICTDISQIWAYRGGKSAIDTIADILV